MDSVRTEGLDELTQQLAGDLKAAQRATSVGLAEVAKGRIRIYPPQPAPKNPRQRYRRGTGTEYRRADGSTSVRKTSETLGRRWAVQRTGQGAELENRASYSAYVHHRGDTPHQTAQHAETGWQTDEGVIEAMQADGTIDETATAAVLGALGFHE